MTLKWWRSSSRPGYAGEVDLEGLTTDLTGVVTVTLRPVSAGVVLIGEPGR